MKTREDVKTVLKDEDLSTINIILESAATETHCFFEEVKAPVHLITIDPNDPETDNADFSSCRTDIYGQVLAVG